MPTPVLGNPAGVWGAGHTSQPEVVELVNGSGATRTAGDVVVLATAANADGVTANTSTTANDHAVVGVVAPRDQGGDPTVANADTYAAGAVMPVIIKGPARINVGANAPAVGDPLTTSATAAVAITNALAVAATVAGTNAVVGTVIGYCLSATKDANNTVLAYIIKN